MQSLARQAQLPRAALLSALPLAGFIAMTVVGAWTTAERSISWPGLLVALPFYAGFIVAPSFVPIAATPPGPLRWLVALGMTAVACAAGIAVITTDDAQAGLAVLWIAFVALPLAAAVGASRALAHLARR